MTEFGDENTPVDIAIEEKVAAEVDIIKRTAEARARRLNEITSLHHNEPAKIRDFLRRLQNEDKFKEWFVEDITDKVEQQKLLAEAINLLTQQLTELHSR